MPTRSTVVHLLTCLVAAAGARAGAPTTIPRPDVIALPGGDAGIGFDDLQYAPGLGRILVPGGRSGRLDLIDPATRAVTAIEGFTGSASYQGGHGQGTTSAVEAGSIVLATDREARALHMVDPKALTIVASAALQGGPDYVRWRAGAHEAWVTEPGKKQIEVLAVDAAARKLAAIGTIAFPDGPESLVIDEAHARAYSHSWKGETYAVDLERKAVVATWSNGCEGSRGVALDAARAMLFVGCAEGRVAVLDTGSGKALASGKAGGDVDSIAYSPALHHLYVPGGATADLSILGVSAKGELTLLGKTATGEDAHTAAIDPQGSAIFVGVPAHGRVLRIEDPFPATP